MKIIKKFNQYIKENLDPTEDMELKQKLSPVEDDLDSIEPGDEDDMDDMDDMDMTDDSDLDDPDFDLIDDIDGDINGVSSYEEDEENEGEIEAHQYIGTQMMNDLASRLGTEVVNNEIEYDGKIINYFSETECFHIDNEKFESVEDAFEFLTNGGDEMGGE
jgi:hypothetical protein